jgi:hypothetical protein
MHETSARRATAELRLLQTEQTWRRENKEIPKSPVLADTMRIIKKFGEMSVTESKVNDAAMRDALEAMLVRPPIRS